MTADLRDIFMVMTNFCVKGHHDLDLLPETSNQMGPSTSPAHLPAKI